MRSLHTASFLVTRLLAALACAFGLLFVVVGTIRLFTYEWYYSGQEPVSLMHLKTYFWSSAMWLVLGAILWWSSASIARRLCPASFYEQPSGVAILVFRSSALIVGFLVLCTWTEQIAREWASMVQSGHEAALIARTLFMRSQGPGLYMCAILAFWFASPWFARFATRPISNS